jgi:hypothetical protein
LFDVKGEVASIFKRCQGHKYVIEKDAKDRLGQSSKNVTLYKNTFLPRRLKGIKLSLENISRAG